jgi:death-on-curing protein
MAPLFLRLDETLVIMQKFGGAKGVRDVTLLVSAIRLVEAEVEGIYLHETVFEVAAAYLYYLCRNSPGNQRTALTCLLVFLRLNGKSIHAPKGKLNALVIAVAEGRASKSAVAVFLENHAA